MLFRSVTRLFDRLYEDSVSGRISHENFSRLMDKYQTEQEQLLGQIQALETAMQEVKDLSLIHIFLGKETIDTNTYGKSSGRSGNYSTNYQISGRELLTPDEVRMPVSYTHLLDASGSDKRYSFRLLADKSVSSVHLFEAAIDLLSYATYLKCEGKDYKSESLLSLSGVYQPKKEKKYRKISGRFYVSTI